MGLFDIYALIIIGPFLLITDNANDREKQETLVKNQPIQGLLMILTYYYHIQI